MSYLEQYAEVGPGAVDMQQVLTFDPDVWVHDECAELLQQLCIARAAAVRGRLNGTGANRPEKTRDLRLGRAVVWTLENSYVRGWAGSKQYLDPAVLKPTAEMEAAGAQIDWQVWLESRLAYLAKRRAECATLALATDRRGWGNHVIYSYDAEIEQLKRVFAAS